MTVEEHDLLRAQSWKHVNEVSREKNAYALRRSQAIQFPTETMSLIMDFTEKVQRQTRIEPKLIHCNQVPLPHRIPPSKNWYRLVQRYPISIMGMIDHAEKPHLKWFPTWKWPKDPNLVISGLFWHIYSRRRLIAPQYYPKKLFLQADNCWSENKNRYVLSFLFVLVMKGIFSEIEMHFLMKGHTHEDVDRMFSFMRMLLLHKSAMTIEDFLKLLQEAYSQQQPTVDIEELKFVWGWKTWLRQYSLKLTHHTQYHAFRFSRGPDGKVMMQVKMSSLDSSWSTGVELVLVEPPGFPQLLPASPMTPEVIADTKSAIRCLGDGIRTYWEQKLATPETCERPPLMDWELLRLPLPPTENLPAKQQAAPPILVGTNVSGRPDTAFAEGMWVVVPANTGAEEMFWIGQIDAVLDVRLRLLYMCRSDEDHEKYQWEVDSAGSQRSAYRHPDEVLAVLDEDFAPEHTLGPEQIAYFEREAAAWRANLRRRNSRAVRK